MPEYLSPGHYFEEQAGPRPIEGVGTAVAAFIGFAPSGPPNKPQFITSWAQYVETYGLMDASGHRDPHLPEACMSHAVYGYFLNGGGRCFVTRVVPKSAEESRLLRGDVTIARIPLSPLADANTPEKSSHLRISKNPAFRSMYGEISVAVELQKGPKNPAQPIELGGSDVIISQPRPSRPVRELSTPTTGEAAASTEASAGSAPGSSNTARQGFTANAATSPRNPSEKSYFTLKIKAVGYDEVVLEDLTAEDPIRLKRRVAEAYAPNISCIDVSVMMVDSPGDKTQDIVRPNPGIYYLTLPSRQEVLGEKFDDNTAVSYKGDDRERSGIQGFYALDDVTMVCCPDLAYLDKSKKLGDVKLETLQEALVSHCALMHDRMAILDAPHGKTAQEIYEWRMKLPFASEFSTLYYPWIKINGPDGRPLEIPPSGHIAGVWARTDAQRGVHKAPANEEVRGAIGLSRTVTRGEQDMLNPWGINCIRQFPGRGIRVWGARTLSADPQWRYINVRRLFNYIEKSIERGTQWVVFEPNDFMTWSRVRRDVSAFLTGTWREGALFGQTPDKAFFVKCDEDLNPSDVRDRGQLVVEIGVAPVKPAEFVIFRISQMS